MRMSRYSLINVFLLSVLTVGAETAPAIGHSATSPATIPATSSLDLSRTVGLFGVVESESVGKLSSELLALAGADSTKPINLIIHSPGGELESGFLLLDVMEEIKAEGVVIRCYVPVLAASMAFQVLVHCNERYVLDRALLLWHPVRIMAGGGLFSGGITITAEMAANLARSLGERDELIYAETSAALQAGGMAEADIQYHFRQETLHAGSRLAEMAPGFCTSFRAIPGLLAITRQGNINSQKQQHQRSQQRAAANGLPQPEYIWREYLHVLGVGGAQ